MRGVADADCLCVKRVGGLVERNQLLSCDLNLYPVLAVLAVCVFRILPTAFGADEASEKSKNEKGECTSVCVCVWGGGGG